MLSFLILIAGHPGLTEGKTTSVPEQTTQGNDARGEGSAGGVDRVLFGADQLCSPRDLPAEQGKTVSVSVPGVELAHQSCPAQKLRCPQACTLQLLLSPSSDILCLSCWIFARQEEKHFNIQGKTMLICKWICEESFFFNVLLW